MLVDRALPPRCNHEQFLPVRRTICSWMLVGWGALPWTHERLLPVQRTGRSWMLVDGALPHGLCALPTCAAHMMLAWMFVGGVLSHAPMSDSPLCSALDARECLWMAWSPMAP